MAGAGKKRAQKARGNGNNNGNAGGNNTSGPQGNSGEGTRAPALEPTPSLPESFDGPNDPRPGSSSGPPASAHGRQASNAPAPSSSGSSRPPPATASAPKDPPKQPAYNRNIDLPGNAYNMWSQVSAERLFRMFATLTWETSISLLIYPIILK